MYITSDIDCGLLLMQILKSNRRHDLRNFTWTQLNQIKHDSFIVILRICDHLSHLCSDTHCNWWWTGLYTLHWMSIILQTAENNTHLIVYGINNNHLGDVNNVWLMTFLTCWRSLTQLYNQTISKIYYRAHYI